MALIACSSPAIAGDWTTYTSVGEINDIVPIGKDVWIATDGGVLKLSLTDSSYTKYTNLDGLASNKVLCIDADSSGNIWFGTQDGGLSQFIMGKGFVPAEHFIGYRINSLLAEDDSTLYVATNVGISLFRPDRDEVKETYRHLGGLPRNTEVLTVGIFDQQIFAGTVGGVAWAPLFQPGGQLTNLRDFGSWLSNTRVSTVYTMIQADSSVYIGTSKGLYRLEGENWIYERLSLPVYDLEVHEGDLVAVTSLGLYRRPISGQRGFYRDNRIPPTIRSAAVASDSTLWAGVAGVGLIGLKSHKIFELKVNSPAANSFMDLALDQRGVLWVASSLREEMPRGAYSFDGHTWKNYTWRDGLPRDYVVSVTVDSRNRVWFGTWGKGAGLLKEDGEWVVVNQYNSVLEWVDTPDYVVVNDFCEDRAGNIWMSNYRRGIAVIDDFPQGKGARYTHLDDGLPSDQGTVLAADSAGLIWFGTEDAGFCLFDDGGTPFRRDDDKVISFSTTSTDNRLTSNHINFITPDIDGSIWVATDAGVNRVQGRYDREKQEFTLDQWDIYLEGIAVNQVAVDSWGNRWFATEEGLFQLPVGGGTIKSYTRTNSGLVDNEVQSLAFDAKTGDLWIGTINGLSRFKLSSAPPLSWTKVYPNPVLLREGLEMKFSGLLNGSTVRIFTLAGELVDVLYANELGEATWEGVNTEGRPVSTGIYLYSTINRNEKRIIGKIALIRVIR